MYLHMYYIYAVFALRLMKICVAINFLVASPVFAVSSGDVASQLRFLLDEERELRQKLQVRVQKLKAEATRLNSTIVPCACPPIPYSTAVAFTGSFPSYMADLTTSVTDDNHNIKPSFNVINGHFVAPVSGVYTFSLTTLMNPGNWVKMQLVKNDLTMLMVKTGHSSSSYVNMATNCVIINVTAGDEIGPQYVSGSSTNIWADGVTMSGILIHAV